MFLRSPINHPSFRFPKDPQLCQDRQPVGLQARAPDACIHPKLLIAMRINQLTTQRQQTSELPSHQDDEKLHQQVLIASTRQVSLSQLFLRHFFRYHFLVLLENRSSTLSTAGVAARTPQWAFTRQAKQLQGLPLAAEVTVPADLNHQTARYCTQKPEEPAAPVASEDQALARAVADPMVLLPHLAPAVPTGHPKAAVGVQAAGEEGPSRVPFRPVVYRPTIHGSSTPARTA